MNSLTRWRPFLTPSLYRRDSLFSDFVDGLFQAPHGEALWSPRVDLKERDDHYLIEAELPGLKADQVEVTFHDGVLTLKGERKTEEQRDGDKVHVFERSYGSFTRSFRFPQGLDPESIEASSKDGVLTVKVPKAEEPKPRQIEIKSSDPE